MNTIPVQYDTDDADFRQLSEFVVAQMREHQVPGVAVGLWHDGRQRLAGYGVTSVENPLPVTADTLFQIGSTTKTVTATIVMRLVEQGLIDLDRPVRDIVPELRLQDKTAEATVTMRHLLTHMGGWLGDFFRETGSGDDALARYVEEMAGLEQVVPVGMVWAYNNAGFGLAARVIEKVTGRPYEAVAQEMVLDPLGMTNSFFFPAEVMSRRFVVGHSVHEGEGPVVERPWALARSAHAVGGLCSSARDQMRYARFHLGDGATETGERLLSPETMAAMQSPQCSANLERQMGLSWFLRDMAGTPTVLHGGATNGQQSAFVMAPSRRFAITVLTNGDEGNMLHEAVVAWAMERYLGLVAPQNDYGQPDADALVAYTGLYKARLSHVELYAHDGVLMGRQIPQGGFPDVDSPASPPSPPSRIVFYAPDRIVALDPPLKGLKAEFLRDEAGQIAWLRTGRLMRRDGTGA